jgi:trk system potassium uptake protein TrkH
MQFKSAFKTVGILLMMFSLFMLPPILVSVIYSDGAMMIFWRAFYITFLSGFVLWLLLVKHKDEMRTRDGFLVTVLFYLALGSFGALPFVPADSSNLNIVDALFESISGFTTTGATVITDIDQLPQSVLFYRQQLQWLGGMGIIVLAVAILPMLGIGGMQLYRAETPGPIKDSKLTPRIKQTAVALWSIYVTLTAACCISYWAAGMSFFDALCHSFSTVAIGGFSTHDQSIGYFNSPLIELVAICFMLIAGINFALHFFAWKQKTIVHYLQDSEVRFYLLLVFGFAVLTSYILFTSHIYDLSTSIRYGAFEVVSVMTTTGFATADFSSWPGLLPFLIFFGAFSGACAGSTGGGMKVVRVMLIYKQAIREIYRLIHPNAIFPIKLNSRPVSTNVIEAVWGFFSIYVIVYLVTFLVLMATGLDFTTAFSSMGACLNNLGPGLGNVAYHYGDINDTAKLILCFVMIMGRLEIFTLLVLLTPMFWQR